MTFDQAIDMVRGTLVVMLLLASPVLLAGLVIGLIVSVLQAVTQVQEQTLSFVPKILGMGVMTILALPWAVRVLSEFSQRMFGGM
jgi:flagellar biosynthesis protein FliQ